MIQPQHSALLESIRDQFNFGPYPHYPLDETAKNDLNVLYVHSLVTPYYLRHQRVFNTENAVILDAGCGTGYKALTLSYANPGAKIVGIDISERSVELARQRFEHHGQKNAEFHVLGIEDVEQLGIQFDYINCDEVLYLFPEPALGLSAFQKVLKPHGIIRGNLHSLLQRAGYFRAQDLFRMLGLMDTNPEEFEIKIAVDIIASLQDSVNLKQHLRAFANDSEKDISKIKESVLMNLLFQGDKGFTMPDLFNALQASDLEMVSMVNWRNWEVLDLFKDPNEMPALLAMSLPEASLEERLRLYELMNPIHRLLDFWCGHQDQTVETLAVSSWSDPDWLQATVHLHPVLRHQQTKELLFTSAQTDQPCRLNHYFNCTTVNGKDWLVESTIASILLPLLEGPQPVSALINRYLKVRPVDPVTLMPFDFGLAFERVVATLKQLEIGTYVLLEK